MASQNEFPGYMKLPKKRLVNTRLRLDFNSRIVSDSKSSRWEGFSLRLFKLAKGIGNDPELSVDLRPEEWLDLIDAMKEEYERAEKARKKFEKDSLDSSW